ncbi:MFS transporter [Desulfitobacterium sp. THU1]|uniref:MFS transporter n=1 Tax=Desulfitobacterium sp. THU1 TaxID=3138072 RepID=UPI00311FE378
MVSIFTFNCNDVLLPMYTSALGLTPLQVTGLFSVFSLGLVIMRLLIGYITDKAGRKPVFVLGLVFYTLSYFIYSNAETISLIYMGRGLQAIASAFISISSYSMIADLNMKDNAHNFGKLDSYSEKGGLLGIILCFYVLNTPKLVDGWSLLFMICAIASIIAVIYSIITLNETKPMLNKSLLSISLPSIKNKIIIFNLAIRIFTSIVSAIFVLYLQSRFNSNLLQIGVAFLLPTVILAFASPKLGRISDTIGSKKILVACLSTLIFSLLILPYTDNIYLYGGVWTVYCIAITLIEITLNGVYVEDIAEEIRGTAIGKLTMGANIGAVIGPIIGGLAFQEISIQAPFFISSIGFAILLMLYMKHNTMMVTKEN